MKQTIDELVRISGQSGSEDKHQKIKAFHYDTSGHVVATNSHILLATKNIFELSRSRKTYSSSEYQNGNLVEAKLDFPEWKQIIPSVSARRINLEIPKWFSLFSNSSDPINMIIDYKNQDYPFFKIASHVDETSLGFNAKYLSCFAGEQVTLMIKDPLSPVIILDSKSSINPLSTTFKDEVLSEQWFYVLMPIKMDEQESEGIFL